MSRTIYVVPASLSQDTDHTVSSFEKETDGNPLTETDKKQATSDRTSAECDGTQLKTEENNILLIDNSDSKPELKQNVTTPQLVPPDGGWGWLVALGAFLNIVLVAGTIPCFSLIFFDILIEFEATTTMMAWIMNLQMFMCNFIGFIAMPIVTEFGYRKVGFTAVAFISLSLLISSYTPSAEFLFFSFSLLNGIGCGMILVICYNIVPTYFERRRGLANALLMAGVPGGQILVPSFIRSLQEGFTGREIILIAAAISLNGLVGMSFFHPLSWHLKKSSADVERSSEEEPKDEPLLRKPSTRAENTKDTDEQMSKASYKKAATEMQAENKFVRKRIHPVRTRQDSISKVATLSLYGSCINVSEAQLESGAGEEDNAKVKKITKEKFNLFGLLLRVARSMVSDALVMRSRKALIITLGMSLALIGHVNFCMMIPFSMQAIGLPFGYTSYAILVMGLSSLVCRVTVSIMSDYSWFNMKWCYMAGFAIAGCSMIAFTLFEEIQWILVAMGFYGSSLGANISLNNLIIIKYMGLKKFPATLGSSLLILSFGSVSMGPIVGLIRDMTQNYDITIRIVSAFSLSSFLLWILMPAAISYDRRNGLPKDSQ